MIGTVMEIGESRSLRIAELPVEEAVSAYGSVKGYWRLDASGHSEQLEPFFYLAGGGEVQVTTRTYGNVNVSLHLFNASAGHGGPSLPMAGGTTSLGPGQWRLYFLGSIGGGMASGIDVEVRYGRELDEEETMAEPLVELEERGEQYKVRADGNTRDEVIRVAYRRAEYHAQGRPFRVLDERVYPEGPRWVCILTCELV